MKPTSLYKSPSPLSCLKGEKLTPFLKENLSHGGNKTLFQTVSCRRFCDVAFAWAYEKRQKCEDCMQAVAHWPEQSECSVTLL